MNVMLFVHQERRHGLRTTPGRWNMMKKFCQRRTILQCVTVMCCSGTTQRHVPCCDRSSYRWDAIRNPHHGAAAHVHSPQSQQQSSWVPHNQQNPNDFYNDIIVPLCTNNVLFLPTGLHDMLFGLWVSVFLSIGNTINERFTFFLTAN